VHACRNRTSVAVLRFLHFSHGAVRGIHLDVERAHFAQVSRMHANRDSAHLYVTSRANLASLEFIFGLSIIRNAFGVVTFALILFNFFRETFFVQILFTKLVTILGSRCGIFRLTRQFLVIPFLANATQVRVGVVVMAASCVVNLSRCGVADEGRGIKEGDGRRLLESRTIGFHRLSRASVEGELACGQVGHIGLASGVANLISLCVGRILYAAGLPAFVAVIGVMVVLSVSITLGGSGTVASRAGRRFIGGGRTFHAFHQLAVATVFDDRRKLRSFGASIHVQLLTPAGTAFVLGQTFASVRSCRFVVGLPGAGALAAGVEMRRRGAI